MTDGPRGHMAQHSERPAAMGRPSPPPQSICQVRDTQPACTKIPDAFSSKRPASPAPCSAGHQSAGRPELTPSLSVNCQRHLITNRPFCCHKANSSIGPSSMTMGGNWLVSFPPRRTKQLDRISAAATFGPSMVIGGHSTPISVHLCQCAARLAEKPLVLRDSSPCSPCAQSSALVSISMPRPGATRDLLCITFKSASSYSYNKHHTQVATLNKR
ncbi:hypothetical protein CDD81_5855 [Ophiocordyceps australis]|uniref:Uncharacterized protein n=1 Tax=Ophiocordyceps australis TaxID=1399860 RepID=A0A2C5YGI4_9HYPO|nr:hypothetical protein CDD81_5855 [Ophiocordyceps australis]